MFPGTSSPVAAVPAAGVLLRQFGRCEQLDTHAGLGDARGMASYPGGKNGSGTYQKLINLMPPHRRYFEPFLGGGALLRLKRPAFENFACDLVGSQVSMVSADLAENGVSAGNIAKFNLGGSAKLAIPAIARIVKGDVGRRQASPVSPVAAGIAVTGEVRSQDPTFRTSEGAQYSLFRGSGLDLLELASLFKPADLVYCDPPYLLETRKGRALYEYEMTAVDHRRLLRAIRRLPCMVMISGYWSSLYADFLKGWQSIHFESMTRGGHTATEWLWFNFPEPVELHDYRYLGTNFRERERIKRKKSRWVGRLTTMPILERRALLSAITDTWGGLTQ
jgi:hypothetical protein